MGEAITADELQRRIARGEGVTIVDVRRRADRDQEPAGLGMDAKFLEGGLMAWREKP